MSAQATRCWVGAAFLLGSAVLMTGCVSFSPPSTRTNIRSSATSSVLRQDEIARSHANSAYEAVQLARPVFLMSGVDLAPLAQRQVYLNGMRLGGIDELRAIPASSVLEIRFVRAIDASGSGIGQQGGAILVVSKVGR